MEQISITELRGLLGTPDKPLTQLELGKLLGGVSQSTVSRMETGEIEPDGPTAIVLRQLADTAKARAA